MATYVESLDLKFSKVGAFARKHPQVYHRANNLAPDNISFLLKVYDNMKLFNRISRSDGKLFLDLFGAIYTADVEDTDTVLIHFTELDLYCVFTPQQYLDFVKNIADDIDDYGYAVSVYQVVISGKHQKLVFACTNVEHFDKMKKYASDCFHTSISTSADQITVNIVNDSEIKIFENYNKLYNYIHKLGDENCCDSMKQIQLMESFMYKYRKYSCDDSLKVRSMDDLMLALRTGHLTVNGPLIIGDKNIIAGDNNKIIINDKKSSAQKWIAENLPEDRENTTLYYEKYVACHPDAIHTNQFGKFVRDQGYTTSRSESGRYWKK